VNNATPAPRLRWHRNTCTAPAAPEVQPHLNLHLHPHLNRNETGARYAAAF